MCNVKNPGKSYFAVRKEWVKNRLPESLPHLVLGPPPGDDDWHVEAEDKGHGDEVGKVVAVDGDLLERVLQH